MNELHFDDSVKYSQEHTWARPEGDVIVVGISDYAQSQLGEVIYVELPQPGDTLKQDETFGLVESAKSVSHLYMPVSGEIVAVNQDLESAPQSVNESPFGNGWMIQVKADTTSELEGLLSAGEYQATLTTSTS